MNTLRKYKTRSWVFTLLLIVLLALLAGGFWVKYRWQAMLVQNNIERLQWQGAELGLGGVSVGELSVIQQGPDSRLTINARDLSLSWYWQNWLPQLSILDAQQLELTIVAEPMAATDDFSSTAVNAPALSLFEQTPPQLSLHLPQWLPPRIRVQQFQASLPCASGQCLLNGALDIQHKAQETANGLPINASLSLEHQGHQVDFAVTIAQIAEGDGGKASSAELGLQLSASIDIDTVRNLTLETQYQALAASAKLKWQGSVAVPELPDAQWLIAWVENWYPLPQEASLVQPGQGSIVANWDLTGPRQHFFAQASGTVNADAQVPRPWPVPGLGQVKGKLALALALDQGHLQPQTLYADLALTQPAQWAATLPEPLRPQQLELAVRPAVALPGANENAVDESIALKVTLRSGGAADISVDGHVAVSTSAPWLLRLAETRVSADLAELQVGQWRINKPQLALLLSGELTPTDASLTLAKSSRISASQIESLANDDAMMPGLQSPLLTLAGNSLTARFSRDPAVLAALGFNGPFGVSVKQVKHPQLLAQAWQFNGNAKADLNSLQLSGISRADSGASANIRLKAPYGKAAAGQAVELSAETRLSGKAEIDALGRLLAAWPELLSASGGTISANLSAILLPEQPLALEARLAFLDVGGTWDRTAWRAMNGTLEAVLKSEQLRLSTSRLTLDEVNPGIPLGPIVLAGDYRASLRQPMAGQLTLNQASAGALDGQLTVAPGRWDFAAAPVTVPLSLDRLSLASLLRVYPAEGLAGTGILSGTIPLLVDPATGIRVKRGRVDALEPGGKLQLSAERLRALGQKNETMELVSKALENFRYSVLDSDIDYDENGTLILGLHLKGNSPDVGGGRALVLNINLQENIPALLTSLQLSGRVTNAVTERVKKLIKKRQREPAAKLLE